MEDIESKLGSILSDPQMMAQIMSMAQQLGGGMTPPPSPPPPEPQKEEFGLDIAAIGKIASMASATEIDQKEKQLLSALSSYLSKERISKLEKAMRAAKLAGIASNLLSSGVLSQLGR